MITAAITAAILGWLAAAGVEIQAWHPIAIGVAVKIFVVTPLVVPLAMWAKKKADALKAEEEARARAAAPKDP